jgi:hypothetical protein
VDLTLEYGSILALKILTGTKTRAILNNTDNKCLKNEEKTFSSSYPPRSSSDETGFKKPVFMRFPNKFV